MNSNKPFPEFRWCGRTDPGRFRKRNEDHFLALQFDAEQIHYLGMDGTESLARNDLLFAVSDGMGGHGGGNFASQLVVEKLARMMPRAFRMAVSGFARAEDELLTELFSQIHRDLVYNSRFYEEIRGMGATLSLVWIGQEKTFFAHIGDSRIYRLPKEGGIEQVTEDHTHVGWLLRQGKISPLEARLHKGKNQLQKALGGNCKDSDPQIGTIDLAPGDRLVLCSDGILEGIGEAVVESALRKPNPRLRDLPEAQRLIQEATEGHSKDNMTAVVVEYLCPD
ncbi:MAG: serine/threonine-protein phosphatase [Opitutales bacterium]|nr:serine/threonine-protein phosphatase [Opitutales bacterium]MCH8539583.1 serine/threonine-protein phosphatase [Opitutales bacterium]